MNQTLRSPLPSITDFRFRHRLRVRWAEVDMQKIVFNGHYLMYLDTAVADYWRALGLPYEEAMHALGGDLYVKKSGLEYFASARMDDQLDVALKCVRIGNSSMVFSGVVFRDEVPLVAGELLYVFADPATQTSRPVPPVLRDILESFERRAPVVDVSVGDWATQRSDAQTLRTQVFIDEQNIPIDQEWDEADATALHALVRNRLGQPIATGRLLQPKPGVGQIGRMAVHRVMRGGGWGQCVARALLEHARARGDHEVMLRAQRSAIDFYCSLGFAPRGPVFDEVGIPHQEMFLALASLR